MATLLLGFKNFITSNDISLTALEVFNLANIKNMLWINNKPKLSLVYKDLSQPKSFITDYTQILNCTNGYYFQKRKFLAKIRLIEQK